MQSNEFLRNGVKWTFGSIGIVLLGGMGSKLLRRKTPKQKDKTKWIQIN